MLDGWSSALQITHLFAYQLVVSVQNHKTMLHIVHSDSLRLTLWCIYTSFIELGVCERKKAMVRGVKIRRNTQFQKGNNVNAGRKYEYRASSSEDTVKYVRPTCQDERLMEDKPSIPQPEAEPSTSNERPSEVRLLRSLKEDGTQKEQDRYL